MALSDIVQVNITTQATAPSRVGFGTPLVMAYHTAFSERARIYKSITAMVDDGFAPNDPAVRAVQAILSQNPKVGEVVEWGGYRYEILDMDDKRIDRVLVTPSATTHSTDLHL